MTPDYRILPLLNALSVTQIEVVFTPTAHLEQKAWLGAAVRNRFLAACEKVSLPEGKTLREAFDVCPLSPDHFLYKQYCNGFPKCFVWDVSDVKAKWSNFEMYSNRVYCFSLYLFGVTVKWIEEITTAIKYMLNLGLGNPPVPLTLLNININENFRLEDFAKSDSEPRTNIQITTCTPLSLLSKKNTRTDGYQSKLNGFPSLYQIARTSIFRLALLNILYSDNNETMWDAIKDTETLTCLIDGMAETATMSMIDSVSLKMTSIYSTPKKNHNNVYALSGYIGELIYLDVDCLLYPIIRMMGVIGLGNDVSYGLGFFETKEIIK